MERGERKGIDERGMEIVREEREKNIKGKRRKGRLKTKGMEIEREEKTLKNKRKGMKKKREW